MTNRPLISVIIPTYNRRRELPALIDALNRQSLPADRYEVIIVDDGSTDGSRDYLRRLGGHFRVLEQLHGGASKARNLAACQAQGQILAFTDDDCSPEPDWLLVIGRRMEEQACRAALLGHTYSEHQASTFVHSVFKDSEPVVTCNFAVSREAFERVGGFDEHFILYFEDEDLGLRLKKAGFAIVYEPAMRVLHPSRYQSFRRFLRLRSGLQYLSYMSQKHPDGDHWQRHQGVVRQIRRKAIVLGLPLAAALIWPPFWMLWVPVLLAHLVMDGSRAWRHRRAVEEAGFAMRRVDLLAFTFLTWAVPFVDAYRIAKGYVRDKGRVRPWRPSPDEGFTAPAGSGEKPRTQSSVWNRRMRTLWKDPRTIFRKARRRAILWFPHRPVQTISLGRVRMELDLRDENMRGMFLEWYEPEEVALLRKVLRPGQIVLDIGASVGYLSAVAAEAVGPAGLVHAFEPVPASFERLKRLAELNPGFRIIPVNAAAGSEEGRLWLALSSDQNIGWNTLVPGLMPQSQQREQIQVPVRVMDAYIAEVGLGRVHFIKVDAEGFEFPILKGLRRCLEEDRPLVLCEVVPGAYPLLGSSVQELQEFLKRQRYQVLDLHLRPLRLESLRNTTNVFLAPER